MTIFNIFEKKRPYLTMYMKTGPDLTIQ